MCVCIIERLFTSTQVYVHMYRRRKLTPTVVTRAWFSHPSFPSAVMLYGLLPSALQLLITSLFWNERHLAVKDSSLVFELRHEHAVANGSLVVFSDVPKFRQLAGEDDRLQYTLKTKVMQSHVSAQSLDSWDEVEVPGPNVTDRETLRGLAMMTNNAYHERSDKKGWYDLGRNWNSVGL